MDKNKRNTENRQLAGGLVYPDDCKIIFLLLIQQAKRDVETLIDSKQLLKKEDWQTAYSFLFDDNYTIDWGDRTLTFSDIAAFIGSDVSWMRYKIRQRLAERFNKHGKKNRKRNPGTPGKSRISKTNRCKHRSR